MSPLISLFGAIFTPEYSIRTYLSVPLVSLSSTPPYSPPFVSPSIWPRACAPLASTWLVRALPRRMTPPQSPGARLPAGLLLVNTTGSSAVPTAMSLEPGCTTSTAGTCGFVSPRIVVPFSMVSVAPAVTFT
ncbi:hypothetical protein BE08_04240 [Sorangium cellulosum]|uniref:Uncharacterized protein n=1 Tax=Sorangium cellulosum TaxID=56 RepID=A0A150NYU9_SORCE|nr:hypothetical protein BE08_04240 [Sorangium cellulosum]